MTARGWTLFAAVSVIWGLPYLFIKIAVDAGLTPGFVAWSRVTLAALLLLPIAYRTGALRGLPLGWLALFAASEIAIPFPLIGFGEQRIPSSLTAIPIASIMLLPFGIADMPADMPSFDAVSSVLVLGLVCSALAFMVFFRLIAEVGPSRAAVITYINPIVALGLGVAILGEDVGPGAVAGLLLILAGSWLSTDGRVPPGLVAIRSLL